MKVLVAGLVKNYQLQRLHEEGAKRGIEVEGCYASDLILYADKNSFVPSLKSKQDLTKFDVIYLMVGSRRWEWYTAALYLNKNFGTKIVNKKAIDPSYNFFLSSAIDYLKQVEEGLPFPQSAIVFAEKSIDNVLSLFTFPVIVKPVNGRKGKGVSKVNNRGELINAAKELWQDNPKQAIVIREFIPNDGDVRVFTVGFKAIGAMKKTPKPGDFRANISQGGSGAPFDLEKNPEVRDLAERVSKLMQTEIAGVDVITNKETGKHFILEINSEPQMEGLEAFTGVNAAAAILDYFEALL